MLEKLIAAGKATEAKVVDLMNADTLPDTWLLDIIQQLFVIDKDSLDFSPHLIAVLKRRGELENGLPLDQLLASPIQDDCELDWIFENAFIVLDSSDCDDLEKSIALTKVAMGVCVQCDDFKPCAKH